MTSTSRERNDPEVEPYFARDMVCPVAVLRMTVRPISPFDPSRRSVQVGTCTQPGRPSTLGWPYQRQ